MNGRTRSRWWVAGSATALLLIGALRCGGDKLTVSREGGADDASDVGDAGVAGDAEGNADAALEPPPQFSRVPDCDGGWRCLVDPSCAQPTTLTGKVFDPAGVLPLPGVVVYVPDVVGRQPAIPRGNPTCTPPEIGDYVAATVTGADGTFRLTGVPTGAGVPLTLQLGKWRRTVALKMTKDCSVNPVADGVLRLPRSRAEGDLPQMALLTGGEDNLGCLLRGIGIDAAEFGVPGSGGRVDVYQGVGGSSLSSGTAGDCTGSTCPLWDTAAHLDAYDAVLLGCEGAANLQTKPAAALQNMHDWLVAGGKLFGVHSQDAWLSQGPSDFAGLASWIDGGTPAGGPFRINTAFPQGASFESWAQATGTADSDGGLALTPSDLASSVAAVSNGAVAWILDESPAATSDGGAHVKAMSARIRGDASISGGMQYCGYAMLTDIHPGGTSPVSTVPSACTSGTLTSEERALEYLFFYMLAPALAVCDGCPRPPPPPPPPYDGG